jgi:ferredoxin/flavodoxin---NADP+ reductase
MNRAIYSPHKVISVIDITPTVFILRIERNNLRFRSGQHINVGPAEGGHTREYSIYSAEQEEFLEVLVKEVLHGLVTPQLKRVKPGEIVMVEEPSGYFILPEDQNPQLPYLFVATGTGIAPYHSYIATNPTIRYTLIHGVTDASEACMKEFYNSEKFVLCTSRKKDGDFHGRVTDWLKENEMNSYSHIFLCGNRNMINEAFAILKEKNFPGESVHAEAYF